MKIYRFLFKDKHIKIILFFLFVLASIKPVFFCWNYVLSNYYCNFRYDNQKGYIYLCRALHYNPSKYLLADEGIERVIDTLVESAIRKKNITIIEKSASYCMNLKKIKLLYQDNFYFQQLFSNLDITRDWENLDNVSFFLLSDPSMNQHTIGILEKISDKLSTPFVKNVVDFCFFENNVELARYLIGKFSLDDYDHIKIEEIRYSHSKERLKNILFRQTGITHNDIGENLIRNPGFESMKDLGKMWTFFNMSRGVHFKEASFQMAIQKIKANYAVRLMGFFIKNQEEKAIARAGIWYKHSIPFDSCVYIFSFDYLTITGQEIPSVWLGKNLKNLMLTPTQGRWTKVIIILNNSDSQIGNLKPLIRMWGKGTFIIDNIFCGKIKNYDLPSTFTSSLIFQDYEI